MVRLPSSTPACRCLALTRPSLRACSFVSFPFFQEAKDKAKEKKEAEESKKEADDTATAADTTAKKA